MKMCVNQPYLIGETAYNHEGNFDYLCKMIDDIAELDLNAVKFHIMLNPESYIQKNHVLLEQIKKWIFKEEQWLDVINRSKKNNLDVVMLCDDVESVNFIVENDLKVDFIEIHATGLNDYFLLDSLSNWDKQIILGIGGTKLDEILYAIDFLIDKGKDKIILMYGFQSYPTNYSDINLSKMMKIKNLFDFPVGYADHTGFDDPNNEILSIMAATMGFNILEKHYTPDFGKERIDYHAAVGKDKMLKIKELMSLALSVYGNGKLELSEPEKKYGNVGPMKKAIVAKRFIPKGEKLSRDNLWFKRTIEESPVEQNQFSKLLGLETSMDINEDEIITFDKVIYEFKEDNLEDFTNIKR